LLRQRRIKIPAAEDEAVYHCITRTVNRERLFDDVAMDILRRQLWQVADYCGVRVHTYAILSNHFHILVHIPKQQPISDVELLRRYRVLYPRPTTYQASRLEVIETELARNGPEAVAWRERQLALIAKLEIHGPKFTGTTLGEAREYISSQLGNRGSRNPRRWLHEYDRVWPRRRRCMEGVYDLFDRGDDFDFYDYGD